MSNKVFFGIIIAAIVAGFAYMTITHMNRERSSLEFNSLSDIQKKGVIRVGIYEERKPWSYTIDDKSVGYNVDLANKIAEDLGVKPEFVYINSAERITALEANTVDLVVANLSITEQRKEKVLFTDPYLNTELGIVKPVGMAPLPDDLVDIDFNKIIVKRGSVAYNYIEDLYGFHADKLKVVENDIEAKTMLLSSDEYLMLTDNTDSIAFGKNYPQLEAPISHSFIGPEYPLAAAVHFGNESLKNAVNKTMNNGDFLKTIYDKDLTTYLGSENRSLFTVID
ncbi:MAG: transporter substrate-binding domain-containing protein [Bifidobacteriaceae bacterium]|jgi:polar amino acid transport system substrate-binding protein|nr:transporter substrate-binding domain-containing protein [Bifidobacteriaceae bacterium]